MAQATRRGLDVMMEVASIYPAAVRYGGGYWSEMVGNVSSQMADVLEAMVHIAARPDRSQEALAELVERSRQYLVASGSTFERMLLDFNQAMVKLSRMYPEAASPPRGSPSGMHDEPMAGALRQLADIAANEALKLQSGQGRPDIHALRLQLESCLAELGRLEGGAGPGAPRDVDQPRKS